MFPLLFGDKTVAFFDLWSFEHFISGYNIGFLVSLLTTKHFASCDKKAKNVLDFCFVLIIELYWEIIEHYLEAGTFGAKIEYWFHGIEHFTNRAISDPLVTVLGFLFFKKYEQYRYIFVPISFIWLFFHIFIFPHSMYLQDIISSII